MGRPARQKPDPEREPPKSTAPQQAVREPETEKGQLAREQYLGFARAISGDPGGNGGAARSLSYRTLYQKYAGETPEVQQAARSLDASVALLALKSAIAPRQVIQVLAQGPFTQHQTRDLSPEGRKAALPGLLQYAQATVEAAQRQRFLEYANAVTGKVWNYPDLYREHIGSDWAAIQLDQKVAAAALKAGESGDAIAHLLQQGPYARFQRDVKQVSPAMIEQYVKGTISQVREIQALRPDQAAHLSRDATVLGQSTSPEVSHQQSQDLDL